MTREYIWKFFLVMLAFYIFSKYLVPGIEVVWEEIVRNLNCEGSTSSFTDPLAVVEKNQRFLVNEISHFK